MIQHVFLRCQESRIFDRIVVATDDARIVQAAAAFGAEAVMTSPNCASGTDRAAEVARGSDAEIIVNVQGDEPAIHPAALRLLAEPFESMAPLVRPLREDERANPNVVKAVLDQSGHALYFSRADLPYARAGTAQIQRWAHVGLYAYRRETLLKLAALPATTLEIAEGLEQLRALGAGIRIACRATTHSTVGVDTPEDVPRAEAALRAL